jgi:large repetitive protein
MRKIFYSFLILLVLLIASGVNAQPVNSPILLTPPNNDTTVSLMPTFTWSSVTGATSYHIQVFQQSVTVIDVSNITTTSYTVTSALTPNTWYYWNVAGANAGGQGPYSGFFNFRTLVLAPSPPTLLTPLDSAINVLLTPTLDWTSVPGASEYRVQISVSPTFNSTVLDVSGLVNSGYVVQGGVLLNSTKYYWRVNAKNSGGTSSWSVPFSFTTVPAPPPIPTLSYPTNGSTGIPVNLTFKWRKSLGATSYRIQVALNNTYQALVIDTDVSDTLYVVPSGTLSGTTQYFWHVKSINVGGSLAYSSTWSFTTGTAPPATPSLLTPPNGQSGVLTTNVLFDWNSVPGATQYRIQIALSSDFGTTFVNQVTANSQYTHTTPAFTNNTVYYWRVNATNSGGTGQWSATWSFSTIQAAPPPPTLIDPPNGSINISLTPTLDWTDVTGATSYRLQISTSTSFTSPVFDVIVPNVSQFTVPSGILQGYTVYYWHVASINAGGQGTYSGPWNFRTLQTFTLNLKVYLEGFYNGSTQIQDTIKVILANATSFAGADTSSAILGPDGSCNGISFARATSGNYWLVIKHRNHLETWSSIVKYFNTSTPVNYDFTTASSQAYGNNMKQVGSAWVLYGGDANQDGMVSPLDYDTFRPQFGLDGYRSCDFNGDGYVDGYDLPILNANFGKNKVKPS